MLSLNQVCVLVSDSGVILRTSGFFDVLLKAWCIESPNV
jgi:hypothetical protein